MNTRKASFSTITWTSAAPNSSVAIEVLSGTQKNKKLFFSDHQTLMVGRAADAGLQLNDDKTISRFHCRFEINPPTCSVIDLGSSNGTQVNGKSVRQSPLSHGDEVTIGKTRVRISIQSGEQKPERDHAGRWETPSSTPEEPPIIPGYRIGALLGEGGMGAVYRAEREAQGRTVAIKVIRPAVLTNHRAIEKFQREAAVVLRLQHKRIVKALDFKTTHQGLPAIIMEFVQQVPFEEILVSRGFPERCRLASRIVGRILEALQYAHEMEIVHRDVKPGNILVFRSKNKLNVKLADFGLAKNYVDAGFTNCSTSKETSGTVSYMAPEQILNSRWAKPPCDIYAAGVTLYRMISNRLPYEANDIATLISLVLNSDPVPLRERVPDVSPQLEKVIHRAMSREESDRYDSAEAMRRDLEQATQNP